MDFNKYFNKDVSVEKFDKGLSNKSYLIDNKYVLKQYMKLNENFEPVVTPLVTKWDVPVKYIDNDVKITVFINGKTFEDEKYSQENIIKFATKLKSFHEEKLVVKHVFNPFEKLDLFISKIKNKLCDYSQYENIINEAKKVWEKRPKQLCHNDLVAGNILFANSTYIIDWEYAGMNDYLFDLASFINENNLTDTNAQTIFLDWYFNRNYKQEFEIISLYNNFQNVLWAAWANMMYDATKSEKHLKIFKDKISRIKNAQ